MRRSTGGTILGAVAIVATLLQTPATARVKIPVMVQTVPPAAGVEFALDGDRFVSDENGLALITVSKPGTHRLEVIDDFIAGSDRRANFSRWSDNVTTAKRKIRVKTFTWLQAGFEVSYRIQLRLTTDGGTPISPERIDSVVLRSDNGAQLEVDGQDSQWIPARTLATTSDGVKPKPIAYALERVIVDGRDVTPAGSRSLVPRLDESWVIAVDLPARVQPAAAGNREVTESSMNWLLALVLAGALLLAGVLWLSRERPRGRHTTSADVGPHPPAAQPERVIDLRSTPAENADAAEPDAQSHVLDDAMLDAQRFIERLEAERRLLAEDHEEWHGSSRRSGPPT